MRPISELTFEHGRVLLEYQASDRMYTVGSLLANGRIGILFSTHQWEPALFARFLPLSEIAQLQEAGK